MSLKRLKEKRIPERDSQINIHLKIKTMETEKYGIEALKEVGTTFAKFGIKLEEAVDPDGPKGEQVAWSESVGLLIFLAPKVLSHIRNREQIKQELQDMSPEERNEWAAHVIKETDLESDVAEEIVTRVIIWMDATADLVDSVRAAKRPKQEAA